MAWYPIECHAGARHNSLSTCPNWLLDSMKYGTRDKMCSRKHVYVKSLCLSNLQEVAVYTTHLSITSFGYAVRRDEQ